MTTPTLFTPEVPAATVAAGPRLYTIELPAGLDLLNANQRLHHAPKAKLTAKIRAAAMEAVAENDDLMRALAKAKPGPLFQRAHILGILRPSTYGRRRDAANWYPSFKAAVDGIVDAGVLDDDDHEHVVGPDMRLGPKARGGQLVLVVSALGPDEDPLDVALGGCQWPDREQVTR